MNIKGCIPIGLIRATHILDDLYNTCTVRTGNYFCEVLGVHNESAYNDLMALYQHKISDDPSSGILFTGPIPNPNDRDLITTIVGELSRMRIGNFINEDISVTPSDEVNYKIRQALDSVIALAIEKEGFSNETIRNNFIAKLIIWANIYIENINFTAHEFPKCIVYGEIKKHCSYFLMLLAQIGFDVVYFNPCNLPTLSQTAPTDWLQKVELGNPAPTLEPFSERAAKGVVVEKVTTYARRATNELEQTLYNDSGVYRPWQFSEGTTRPITMDSVIEDTMTYWDEPARMRPGFKTTQNTVYTPIFFSKVSGVHREINDYYSFVQKLREAKKCLFYESPHLINVGYGQKSNITYHNMSAQTVTHAAADYNQKDLYSLAFCLNPDKTVNKEKVKEHVLYQKMLVLRPDLQTFILNKLDELFVAANNGFFTFEVTDKERVRLMASLFTADDKLLNLIDSYDFTSDIPKIIMYVNSRDTFNTDDFMLLGLLKAIGLDFILLSPNGANNLELGISNKFINHIKLDEFVYDLQLRPPSNKKKSIFNKLFR